MVFFIKKTQKNAHQQIFCLIVHIQLHFIIKNEISFLWPIFSITLFNAVFIMKIIIFNKITGITSRLM